MTTHGRRSTPIYTVWCGILTRCRNPKSTAFHEYGARGITVCERWLKFENFLEDMGDRPEGMTVERIDNNGSYSKNNCRWASPLEQGRNRRNNHVLTHKGETMPVSAWAEKIGISKWTLFTRIAAGWSTERLLETPARKQRLSREYRSVASAVKALPPQ